MPRFYQYAGQPVQYNATARTYGQGARAASTKSLGSYGSLGSRYRGPQDLGPALGKLNVYGYAGGQDLGYASNFGGQNKDIHSLSGILPALSDNEKRLVTIGVIGIVAWLAFGDKIKKALK